MTSTGSQGSKNKISSAKLYLDQILIAYLGTLSYRSVRELDNSYHCD